MNTEIQTISFTTSFSVVMNVIKELKTKEKKRMHLNNLLFSSSEHNCGLFFPRCEKKWLPLVRSVLWTLSGYSRTGFISELCVQFARTLLCWRSGIPFLKCLSCFLLGQQSIRIAFCCCFCPLRYALHEIGLFLKEKNRSFWGINM